MSPGRPVNPAPELEQPEAVQVATVPRIGADGAARTLCECSSRGGTQRLARGSHTRENIGWFFCQKELSSSA